MISLFSLFIISKLNGESSTEITSKTHYTKSLKSDFSKIKIVGALHHIKRVGKPYI